MRARKQGVGTISRQVTAQIAEVVFCEVRYGTQLGIVQVVRSLVPSPGGELKMAGPVSVAGKGEAVVDEVDTRTFLVPEHVAWIPILLS